MAPVRGCQTKILIDEYDLSGQSNSVNIDASVAVLDYVTFQACYQQRTPGLPSSAIAHNGYFNGSGAGQLEEELHARLGSGNDVYVGVILGTELAIPVGYVLATAFGQQLKLDAPVDGLLTVQGARRISSSPRLPEQRRGQTSSSSRIARATLLPQSLKAHLPSVT